MQVTISAKIDLERLAKKLKELDYNEITAKDLSGILGVNRICAGESLREWRNTVS